MPTKSDARLITTTLSSGPFEPVARRHLSHDNQGVAEFVQLLKPLQDDLGYINDVRVANELLTDLQISNAAIARAAGIVLGWHDRDLADTDRKLRKHVRRFREARPFW